MENNSLHRINRTPSLLKLCILAIAVSLFFVAVTYAPGFLSGQGAFWEFRTDDGGVHLTGLRYFIHDQWRFPIFDVQGINYPEGTNIIFTDSLPLMAVVAKVLYKFTSYQWNYFGFWTIISNVMLAVSTAFLLHSVRTRSYMILFAAVVLALSTYELLYRSFFHIALSSMFLIVFALALYFYSLHPAKTKSSLLWFVVLLSLCPMIHLYLYVMAHA